VARRLYEAYLAGNYSELKACEMMVLCYAGWTEDELRDHTRRTLALSSSRVEAFTPLLRIINWAREQDLRCIIVSASPKLVVEEAAAPLGFERGDVAAGHARARAGRIEATLSGPIPYAATKVQAARSLFADAPWLATFGDNAFDIDMLRAAERAVLVRPKQRLLALTRSLTDPVLLTEG
jgi:phosphoserine phosphatase